jgi:hypothetical protein
MFQAKVRFRVPDSTVAVDPANVEFKFTYGDGTQVTWTYGGLGAIIRRKQGVYEASYLLTVPGTWYVKVTGDGDCDIVEEANFPVTLPKT